jgi:two-component system cell cycle response regulator
MPRDILLIEDNQDSRDALAWLLEHHGYSVRTADNGADALKEARRQPPDLVITDLAMPVLSGFDLLQRIRELPMLADTPVIVVSGHADVEKRVAGLDLGADDFLAKPVIADELLARVRRQLARADRQQEVARQSMIDQLTNILNRRGLSNFFSREAARPREDGRGLAVIVIDLNGFKAINDSRGHAAGDAALCEVSRAVQDALRATDRIGRMGGDEFAVVLTDVRSEDCLRLSQRVRRVSPVMIDLATRADQPSNETVRVGLALGCALAEPGESFEQVIARADAAMYEDKRHQQKANQTLT